MDEEGVAPPVTRLRNVTFEPRHELREGWQRAW